MRIIDNYNIFKVIKQRYRDMRRRSSGKTVRKYHSAQGNIISYPEFLDWCFESDNIKVYDKLFTEWEKADFVKRLAPSIDRIDSAGTYTLDNIQWLSLSDNARKHNKTID